MLPDPIERGEMRCEDWALDNVHGGMMTCGCGRECRLDDAETTSADPYAIPVCPTCFVEWFQERKRESMEEAEPQTEPE